MYSVDCDLTQLEVSIVTLTEGLCELRIQGKICWESYIEGELFVVELG